MSESKWNPVALFAASLPPLMTRGEHVAVTFDVAVMPSPEVLLLRPGHIRKNDDGTTSVLLPDGSGEWEPAPAGRDPRVLGEELPPEKCDVVFGLATVVQEVGSVITGPGQRRPRLSRVGHVPFHRMPLLEWRAGHEANLRDKDKDA